MHVIQGCNKSKSTTTHRHIINIYLVCVRLCVCVSVCVYTYKHVQVSGGRFFLVFTVDKLADGDHGHRKYVESCSKDNIYTYAHNISTYTYIRIHIHISRHAYVHTQTYTYTRIQKNTFVLLELTAKLYVQTWGHTHLQQHRDREGGWVSAKGPASQRGTQADRHTKTDRKNKKKIVAQKK